jgi:phosphoglycerate dehydrogenase-like enzyme
MAKDTYERSNSAGEASSHRAGIGSAKPVSVGFIGLGRMGTVMAANLAAAGYRVVAYVRRQDQMDKLTGSDVRIIAWSAFAVPLQHLRAAASQSPGP